jgi:hypothetical protein
VFEVHRVVFLNHFYTGAAVLGDLVNVGPLDEAQADVGVTKAVQSAAIAVAIELHLLLVKNGIEQFVV